MWACVWVLLDFTWLFHFRRMAHGNKGAWCMGCDMRATAHGMGPTLYLGRPSHALSPSSHGSAGGGVVARLHGCIRAVAEWRGVHDAVRGGVIGK